MKTALFLFAWLLLQAPAPARAQPMYEQSYGGHMVWHNQVEFHTIQVYSGTGHLRIWTDSGAGFNPVLTLWHKGVKLAMNDDHTQYFNYYQDNLDAGIELFGLEDGTYVATITASPNFPLGNSIGAGFAYDLQAPIPMATWCPPGSPGPPGTSCPKDRHFSLHWTVQ